MTTSAAERLTVEEYLELERTSEIRHEFSDGRIFAMSGTSLDHNRIKRQLAARLAEIIDRSGDCEVFDESIRVRTADGLYTDPDIIVACGTLDLSDDRPETLLNPTVLIEMLSPSTEADDRGAKFRRYRTIASLTDYLVVSQDQPRVSQDQPRVSHYTRGSGDPLRLNRLRDRRAGRDAADRHARSRDPDGCDLPPGRVSGPGPRRASPLRLSRRHHVTAAALRPPRHS